MISTTVKLIQPLYFLIQIMLFKYRFEFLKISVTYDYILKTDPRVKLMNEIYFDTNVYVNRSVRLLLI